MPGLPYDDDSLDHRRECPPWAGPRMGLHTWENPSSISPTISHPRSFTALFFPWDEPPAVTASAALPPSPGLHLPYMPLPIGPLSTLGLDTLSFYRHGWTNPNLSSSILPRRGLTIEADGRFLESAHRGETCELLRCPQACSICGLPARALSHRGLSLACIHTGAKPLAPSAPGTSRPAPLATLSLIIRALNSLGSLTPEIRVIHYIVTGMTLGHEIITDIRSYC